MCACCRLFKTKNTPCCHKANLLWNHNLLCCLQWQKTAPEDLFTSFSKSWPSRPRVSRSQIRSRLAKQQSVRSKLLRQRNNFRRRLRELARPLETKEAEIQLVGAVIQHLETSLQDGTDWEDEWYLPPGTPLFRLNNFSFALPKTPQVSLSAGNKRSWITAF